jgi:uncharacterized protein
MKYREFGNLDWKVSALGFGAMRLPTTDTGAIDEPLAIEMMRRAIDEGVNYVDTAYPYHSQQSEVVVGRALQDGYRDRVKLATKLNTRFLESADDMDPMLDEQLQKLQTDHIDMYLLHGIRQERWDTLRAYNALEWAERKREEGLIKYFGFSFHGDYDLLVEVIDAHPGWDFCQVQYNYMDIENQAGTKGVQYAASRGLGVVVMEPMLGGRLVDPPEQVQALWDSASVKRSAVDWALQWVWNQPEASVALSGMSNMQQVEENLASADRSGVGSLTAEELALFDQVRELYDELCPVPCTNCQYCMPCPNGVNIPGVFRMLNAGVMYNQLDQQRRRYQGMDEGSRASACIQCRICEEVCPQSILISEWMPEVDEVLGQGKAYTCRID